ncbi:phage tail protein [Bacillaceae bacterium IKA-2]|nr:phage tail protein [Bacillaceae bacterium IKA-2]
MINIHNIKLLDLLPPNLRSDPDIIAASSGLDSDYWIMADEAKKCIILPRIKELSGPVIDLLAWEFRAPFYDTSLPIEIRRDIVENSLRWHSLKGTPQAVESAVTTIYSDAELLEWFNYNGDPFLFKIVLKYREKLSISKLNQVINATKNKRSKLDGFLLLKGDMFIKLIEGDMGFNFNPLGPFFSGVHPEESIGSMRQDLVEVNSAPQHGYGIGYRSGELYGNNIVESSTKGSSFDEVVGVTSDAGQYVIEFPTGEMLCGVYPTQSSFGSTEKETIEALSIEESGASIFPNASEYAYSGLLPYKMNDGYGYVEEVNADHEIKTGIGRSFPSGVYHCGEVI